MVTTSDGGGRGRTQPESWCQDRWDTFGGVDPPSGALATNERVRARARKAQVSRGFSDGDSFGPSPRILLLRTPPLIFVTAEPISMVTCSGDVRGIGTSFGEIFFAHPPTLWCMPHSDASVHHGTCCCSGLLPGLERPGASVTPHWLIFTVFWYVS